ncbi:MAG: DegT/DnrJ/EryC1/StrS aminotransferase family protein [Lentisphaeria bacterium]
MKAFPLMHNNITREDIDALIAFLDTMPRLTQGDKVRAFEQAWSQYLGVKHSIYVNSGASANWISIAAFKHLYGSGGEIIVPPLTWVSDISSVISHGFKPVFVDIDPRHLGMQEDKILAAITEDTRAVFLTYVQGFNALSDRLIEELAKRGIPLLEDVCESHGATHKGKKLGSFGLLSNFSYYFAHHMSTIEGGMVSTDSDEVYQCLRMLRSHGMLREADDEGMKRKLEQQHADLSPDFIFMYPSNNFRGTELGGVLGLSQLPRLEANNALRNSNLRLFLELINPQLYRVDYRLEGSSNYAFPLVLQKPDLALRDRLESLMRKQRIEFRRGNAGGGNQMRQPYLQGIIKDQLYLEYPEVEHIHFFGYYIGNYPALQQSEVRKLCNLLNQLK